MPSSAVNYVVATTGRPKKEIEDLWHKAKGIAGKEGYTGYDYIMGIFKQSLGHSTLKQLGWSIREDVTFENWLSSLLNN